MRCPASGPEARFVVNRLVAGTRLASEVAEALASFEAPALQARMRNRTEYAKAVRDGLTALETASRSAAARDCVAFAAEIRALLEERCCIADRTGGGFSDYSCR